MAERRKAIANARERFPTLLSGLRQRSRNELKRRVGALDSRLVFGQDFSNVTLVELGPFAVEVSERYGKKLGRALHYFHTREILPKDALVLSRLWTNAALNQMEIPTVLMGLFDYGSNAVVVRSAAPLDAQFRYQYIITEGSGASCFRVFFGESMMLVIAAFKDGPGAMAQHLAQRFDAAAG